MRSSAAKLHFVWCYFVYLIIAEKAKAKGTIVGERCRCNEWRRSTAGVGRSPAEEGDVEGEGGGEEAGGPGVGRECVRMRGDEAAINNEVNAEG